MIVFGVVAGPAVVTNTLVYSIELFSIFNALFILSYMILSGIGFFLPLYALTDVMRDAKRKLLLSIDERYLALNKKHGSGADDLGGLSDEHIADLKALKSLQQTGCYAGMALQ